VGNGLFGGKFDLCTDPDIAGFPVGGGGGSDGGVVSAPTDKGKCIGAFLRAPALGWARDAGESSGDSSQVRAGAGGSGGDGAGVGFGQLAGVVADAFLVPRAWVRPPYGFETLGRGYQTLSRVATLKWREIVKSGMATTLSGYEKQPVDMSRCVQ